MAVQVVKPRIRGFICTNAHPVGCDQNVRDQIDHVKSVGHRNLLISTHLSSAHQRGTD